jgi:hypothetical protein
MNRFFLTVVLVAALGFAAGVWWDGRVRTARRREQGEIALRVERALEREVTLEGYAGKPEIREVLRHLARQVDVPIFVHRDLLEGRTTEGREEIHLPPVSLSLRSMIGMLSRQGSFGYYINGRRLVITTEQDAGNRLETKVYPLPQVAGPEQPFGADQDTWIEVLSVVIEPDSWDNAGGPGEIVPVPGALIIRQTHRAHERLRQFFDKLHRDLPTPDAQGDYLSSYSPEEGQVWERPVQVISRRMSVRGALSSRAIGCCWSSESRMMDSSLRAVSRLVTSKEPDDWDWPMLPRDRPLSSMRQSQADSITRCKRSPGAMPVGRPNRRTSRTELLSASAEIVSQVAGISTRWGSRPERCNSHGPRSRMECVAEIRKSQISNN